jgi:hypothetical protein
MSKAKQRDTYSKNLEKFEKFLKDSSIKEVKKETTNKDGKQIPEKN